MAKRKNFLKNSKIVSLIILIIAIAILIYEYINLQGTTYTQKTNFNVVQLGEFPNQDNLKTEDLQIYFFDVGQGTRPQCPTLLKN